jgi:hypothetical protein
MSSTSFVDFSVRQNKAIERSIVFGCLQELARKMELENPVYVGFGSVWFVDFIQAHRHLAVDTMISIESDEIIFNRAKFNKPFRTVEVYQGFSSSVIPELLHNEQYAGRPWIVWLDYDSALDEDKLAELQYLIQELPENSILLTTFTASSRYYGKKDSKREEFLRGLLGDALVDSPFPDAESLKNVAVQMKVLSQSALDFLVAAGLQGGRAGGAFPAFRLMYQDGSPMVTVGVALTSGATSTPVEELIGSAGWRGEIDQPISTPPLTAREMNALQAALPTQAPLTRADVREMGFDLLDDQIASFTRHYLEYPSFVQVTR